MSLNQLLASKAQGQDISPELIAAAEGWEQGKAEDFDGLIARGATFRTANRFLMRYGGDQTRMGIVLDLRGHMLDDEWLRLVGRTWSLCDAIRNHSEDLRGILGTEGPLREMMTAKENAKYDSLPEEITVYRGCDASVLTGASWSLNKAIAVKFPMNPRYYAANPVVVSAVVKKRNALALLLARSEMEIVTFSAEATKVEPIAC